MSAPTWMEESAVWIRVLNPAHVNYIKNAENRIKKEHNANCPAHLAVAKAARKQEVSADDVRAFLEADTCIIRNFTIDQYIKREARDAEK